MTVDWTSESVSKLPQLNVSSWVVVVMVFIHSNKNPNYYRQSHWVSSPNSQDILIHVMWMITDQIYGFIFSDGYIELRHARKLCGWELLRTPLILHLLPSAEKTLLQFLHDWALSDHREGNIDHLMSVCQSLCLVSGTANEERYMKESSSFTNFEVGTVQKGVGEGRNMSNFQLISSGN